MSLELESSGAQPGGGGKVMYNATVRALPFDQQCLAAALVGCDALTMTPSQYLTYLNGGMATREILATARDHGVAITHLDPLARWTPKWIPGGHKGAYPLSALAFEVDDFFRMCAALGCRSFTALGTHPPGALESAELIDHFGQLCWRADREGLRVDLEFAPLWGLASLEQAWDVLRGAGAPNSGLMFDTWHFRRSDSSSELLAAIPGHMITGVQLNDGELPLPENIPPIVDCLFRRRPPGEGDFKVREIVAILRGTGGLNNVGPEIFSSKFDKMSATDIAARCNGSLDAVLN
jgi:sugar phosphate isomerase/epimerase